MKTVTKGFIFIVILLIINIMFTFVFVPVNGASEVMWNDYYKMKDLDTVYVGSSVCLRSFNPYIIDEKLGTNSFNMGTPSQPMDLTYLALSTAIEQHAIERVYFGFGYFNLTMPNSQQSEAAFLQARNRYLGFWERLQTNLSYITKKENIGKSVSVNFLFPWIYNHVPLQVGAVKDNIKAKLPGASDDFLLMVNDGVRNYEGRGFGYYKGIMDYSNIGDDNSVTHYYGEIRPELLEQLEAICRLCRENEIELIIINTPRPTFDILIYGEEYYTTYEWLVDFCEEQGAEYYDFNLARPEIFESKPEYYFNFEHLNKNGADAFSRALAEFELRRREDKDIRNAFYNWTEYLEAVET